MAVYSPRHFGSLKIIDGAGTPVELDVSLYSTPKVEEGYEAYSWIMDENLNISTDHPALKGQGQPSKFTFQVKQTGFTNSGTLSLGDIIHRTAAFDSLVSTIAGGGSQNTKHLNVVLTWTDGTNTQTITAEHCIIRGTLAFQDDGNVFDVTCEGPKANFTHAYA